MVTIRRLDVIKQSKSTVRKKETILPTLKSKKLINTGSRMNN